MAPEAQKQLAKAAVNKPSNSDLYSVEMAEFVDTFRRLAMPKEFKYLFFVEGGSLAIENALKVAFDYKVRQNFRKGATKEIGSKVVHFKNAFHGRSGYTLSLNNTLPDKIAYFPKFDWPRLDAPGMRFPMDAQAEKEVAAAEERTLKQLNWLGQKDADDIACVIIETIQSEGGDVHFRKSFLQGLREICDKYDWLLIFDEVQTGFGMTGKMWAFEHFDVLPDIACFGKKAQVCGIMVRDTVDRVPDNVFKVPSRINSTWGGNLTDMVRCKMYLEIIHAEKMIENSAVQGEKLLAALQKICLEFKDMIYNPRGRGLLCAFTFHKPEVREKFLNLMMENETIILKCGPSSVRFRPALNLSTADLEESILRVRKCLAALK